MAALRRFNSHCTLVDRNKGPASDFLVQLDEVFIRFNFSYPDTHMLFSSPSRHPACIPLVPRTVSTNLILRGTAEAERVGVACMPAVGKDPLAAGSQLTITAGSHCPEVGCWDPHVYWRPGFHAMSYASPGAVEQRTYPGHIPSDGGEGLGLKIRKSRPHEDSMALASEFGL